MLDATQKYVVVTLASKHALPVGQQTLGCGRQQVSGAQHDRFDFL
jgi:hypothetical protein